MTATPSRRPSSTVTGKPGRDDGEEDDVRRRQLLASLALTAAGAASTRISRGIPPAYPPESPDAGLDDILISRVRDAMLGLAPSPRRFPLASCVQGWPPRWPTFTTAGTAGWPTGSPG